MDRGFSGMVVTDHFYHGNTAVDRSLPWDIFVDEFCQGYYRAKAEGDKHGFVVLFGFEHKFYDGTDEYIVLGISPEWLKSHPEIKDMDRIPFFKTIRAAGGFVIQAHPYRVRYYIREIHLALDYVDAVEVVNIGDNEYQSRQSYEYAMNLNLPMTAGTDAHTITNVKNIGGVGVENKITSIDELIAAIKERRTVLYPAERFETIKATPLENKVDLDVYELTDEGLKITDNLFANN